MMTPEQYRAGVKRCGSMAGDQQCRNAAVDRYLVGWRCEHHTPAALAGRTVPDPVASLPTHGAAVVTRIAYGTASTDPLGRTVPGTARTGFIPSRPKAATT